MKIIAYHRVSTINQKIDGLSMQYQRDSIREFATRYNHTLVSEYTEIASGGKFKRIELTKALNECELQGCVLVVSKLDRLTRSLKDVMLIRERNVKFISLENIHMSDFEINLRIVFAEEELRKIQERTKQGLSIAKKTKKLGSPQGFKIKNCHELAAIANREKALLNINNIRAKYAAKQAKETGKSLRTIANELNNNGYKTSTGNKFSATSVNRLLR